MSLCGRCGAVFHCAMVDGAEAAPAQPCWCTLLPAAVPLPREAAAGCWCADCLRSVIADASRTDQNIN